MSFTRSRWQRILIALVLVMSSYLGVIRFMPEGGHQHNGLFLVCLIVLVVSAFIALASAIWWPVVFISNREFRHAKALGVTAVLMVVAAFILFMPALARSQRKQVILGVRSALLSSYVDLQRGEALTNSRSVDYHVYLYTNRYVIGGTVYRCVLAADSWDYQGLSNLLVLTTDKRFLYIGRHGAVPVSLMPPGY